MHQNPYRGSGWTAMAEDMPSYEIRVRGVLGDLLLSAFPFLHARRQDRDTVLSGALADQAALYGVLAQMESLGLELVEIRRLTAE